MKVDAAQTNAGFVEVGGLRLWTSVRGEGRPLLMLNGIGASVEIFDPLRAALETIQTIAFDVPGAGRSPGCVPLRLHSLALIIREMLDVLGHAEVDVLGV